MNVNIPGDIKARLNDLGSPTLARMVFSVDRAWWWREVTDLDEVIPKGCPVRWEPRDNWELSITETVRSFERERSGWPVRGAVFIDTRWTPPAKPPKVGDVIEKAEDVKHLPDGSVFLDCDGEAWQVDDDGIAYAAGGGRWFVDGDFDYLPLTVIYVPKAGGSDD